MTMTRRDYLLIADAIREAKIAYPLLNVLSPDRRVEETVRWIEERLAYRLYRYDPRFDKAMFREACRTNQLKTGQCPHCGETETPHECEVYPPPASWPDTVGRESVQ